MAVRRGVSRQQWQERIEQSACLEGREWVRQFDTAGAAWKACRTGGFMAWWLYTFYNVPTKVLQKLTTNDRWCLTNDSSDYADVLRQHYNVDGTRRSLAANAVATVGRWLKVTR